EYNFKNIFLDILKYPPFIAFVIAVILRFAGFRHTELSVSVLERLGNLIVFLALISVGLQLKIKGDGISYRKLAIGLFFKLILAPAFVFLLFYIIAQGRGLSVDVSLIESAMPPMVMGSVMAVSYGLNPRLSNLMVGIGIPVSAVTLLLWYLLIKAV
ncbi:MAG: AEC family transporter, partial [Ignavibacteria bacterium]|nr:AEC family transporter [Ignavibacteria bacterium]